ncbi:hypothetical protein BDFB_011442 [Asbolus verrucosus]|uniref:Uncharacterized protein n=1 Tax=Asbolus verrucosus TaxID=1661398 RepID=A0A482V3Z7_ASBVE|nr:hypothetical protein BDFB_011442 [Asbolus verrucosus]
MESIFKSPESLVLNGNVATKWKRFRQKFEFFADSILPTSGENESVEKNNPEKKKVDVLLSCIGDDGLDLYNTFAFVQEGHKQQSLTVTEKFEAHCSPKVNVVFERYMFNSIVQKENQSFDSFGTELKKAVKW